jgi:hypothetical protein
MRHRIARVLVVPVLIALTLGGGLATLRAVAQDAPATPPAKAEPPRNQPAERPAPPARRPVDRSIGDDPLIAPDPEESADNNLTFPVDI